MANLIIQQQRPWPWQGTRPTQRPRKRTILTSKASRRAAKRNYIFYHHSLYLCKIKNCVTCAENFIVNLSSHELSVLEKLILSRGLTFIPLQEISQTWKSCLTLICQSSTPNLSRLQRSALLNLCKSQRYHY